MERNNKVKSNGTLCYYTLCFRHGVFLSGGMYGGKIKLKKFLPELF